MVPYVNFGRPEHVFGYFFLSGIVKCTDKEHNNENNNRRIERESTYRYIWVSKNDWIFGYKFFLSSSFQRNIGQSKLRSGNFFR